jgi:hypothetical protein
MNLTDIMTKLRELNINFDINPDCVVLHDGFLIVGINDGPEWKWQLRTLRDRQIHQRLMSTVEDLQEVVTTPVPAIGWQPLFANEEKALIQQRKAEQEQYENPAHIPPVDY